MSILMVTVDAEVSGQGQASAVALELPTSTPENPTCRATQLAVLQLGTKEIADHAERISSSLGLALVGVQLRVRELRGKCTASAQAV